MQIIKNTLQLYIRMLFSVFLTIYISRRVLNILGVSDFGIYNLIGGFVALFSILNISLSSATQRFLTIEIGKKNIGRTKDVFTVSLAIHILIILIIFILCETFGLWFINNGLNVDQERLIAINWVYQLSLITVLIQIFSVPIVALITSYEKFAIFSFFGILEVLLKALIVYLMPIFSLDKLILYSFSITIITIIISISQLYFCKRNFIEFSLNIKFKSPIYQEFMKFVGWNFIGSSSFILMTQGLVVLINLFFGVTVNAAQAISNQVQNTLGGFVNNFMSALNPQITKSYSSDNILYMNQLIFQGSKFSYLLFFFFSNPLFIEIDFVLKIWLIKVPSHTVNFVRLTLIFTLIQSLSNTLVTAISATGKIKMYQLVVGGTLLLNLPISYLFLFYKYPPEAVYFISIILAVFALVLRLLFAKKLLNFDVIEYLLKVIVRVIFISILTWLITIPLHITLKEGSLRLFFVLINSGICVIVFSYFFGFSNNEKKIILSKVKYKLNFKTKTKLS